MSEQRMAYLTVEMCPRHGFPSLAVMAVDRSDVGTGTRLLGQKSCCASRREVARWSITAEKADEMAREIAQCIGSVSSEG